MIVSDVGLVAAACGLLAEGRIHPRRGYARAELLPLLTATYGSAAEAAFMRLRSAAAGRSLPGLSVRVEGDRRGARYFFDDGLPHEPIPDATPTVSSDATPRAEWKYQAPAAPSQHGRIDIHFGDNLPIIEGFGDASFNLIYIDPPFNTGKVQARTQITTVRDDDGDRVGFQGKRYRTTRLGTKAFADCFDDYIEFLAPRLEQAHRLLAADGSLFLHLDYREVHYAKIFLDQLFGRECFVNEIIWSYDYGARATQRWSPKHDNILWYSKNPESYCFNYDDIDRIPYMAPTLVGEEKAARGKTPTDTWWNTIVSPNGHEKTGYPTQKPLSIVRRIVAVHSRPGDRLLDFFAGSGTLGEAGASASRDVVLVDAHPEAINVMAKRLAGYAPTFHGVSPSGVSAGAREDVPEADVHPTPTLNDNGAAVDSETIPSSPIAPPKSVDRAKRDPLSAAKGLQVSLFE